jgi:hypothetical protein
MAEAPFGERPLEGAAPAPIAMRSAIVHDWFHIANWEVALDAWAQQPIAGIGAGGFHVEWLWEQAWQAGPPLGSRRGPFVGLDLDWEVPAVTLPALLLAVALIGRSGGSDRVGSRREAQRWRPPAWPPETLSLAFSRSLGRLGRGSLGHHLVDQATVREGEITDLEIPAAITA